MYCISYIHFHIHLWCHGGAPGSSGFSGFLPPHKNMSGLVMLNCTLGVTRYALSMVYSHLTPSIPGYLCIIMKKRFSDVLGLDSASLVLHRVWVIGSSEEATLSS